MSSAKPPQPARVSDVRRRTVLPSALQNRSVAQSTAPTLQAAEYLDQVEENLNRQVDKDVKTLVEGMTDLVRLSDITSKDHFRVAQDAFQTSCVTESMIRSAHSLLALSHTLKLLHLFADTATPTAVRAKAAADARQALAEAKREVERVAEAWTATFACEPGAFTLLKMGYAEKAVPRVAFLSTGQQDHRRRLSIPVTPPETPIDFAFFPKTNLTTIHQAYPTDTPPHTPVRRVSMLSKQTDDYPTHHDEHDLPTAYHANRKSSILETRKSSILERRGSILTHRRLSSANILALARHTSLTPTKVIYLFIIVFSATYLASFLPLPFRSSASRPQYLKPPPGYYRPPPPYTANEERNQNPSEAERRSWSSYRNPAKPVNGREALEAINIDSDIIRAHPEAYVDTPARRRGKAGKARMNRDLDPGSSAPIRRQAGAPASGNNSDRQAQLARMKYVNKAKGARGGALDSSRVVERPDPRDQVRRVQARKPLTAPLPVKRPMRRVPPAPAMKPAPPPAAAASQPPVVVRGAGAGAEGGAAPIAPPSSPPVVADEVPEEDLARGPEQVSIGDSAVYSSELSEATEAEEAELVASIQAEEEAAAIAADLVGGGEDADVVEQADDDAEDAMASPPTPPPVAVRGRSPAVAAGQNMRRQKVAANPDRPRRKTAYEDDVVERTYPAPAQRRRTKGSPRRAAVAVLEEEDDRAAKRESDWSAETEYEEAEGDD